MTLFNWGKKKTESCCSCSEENNNSVNCCCDQETINDKVYSIKVLGAGCKACHTQYENVKEAVANLGISVEVEYITNMEKVMTYGVMSMPAIVVNDTVVSMGKVLKSKDVAKLLQK